MLTGLRLDEQRTYTFRFAKKIIDLRPLLIAPTSRSTIEAASPATHVVTIDPNHTQQSFLPAQVSYDLDLKAAFKNLTYRDKWSDAGVTFAIRYVFGCRSVKVPESWRDIIPKCL